MKFIGRALASMFLIVACTNCQTDDGPGAKERTYKQLTESAWILESAALDNEDYTDLYEGMTLTFSRNGTYNTFGGNPPVWSESGTYELVSSSVLLLDGDRQVTIETAEAKRLVLSFTYAGASERTTSVGGNYSFAFMRP
jgi:hypothetical protein